MRYSLIIIFTFLCNFVSAATGRDVVLENATFKLVIGSNGITKSLLYKPLNEECIVKAAQLPIFAATQERPYDNEVKLAHLNKLTTFQADTIYKEGNDKLVVGFETIPYKAVVKYKITAEYIWFSLVDFKIDEKGYRIIKEYMTLPMTSVFTLIQLPVKKRANFGEWLNVMWDDKVAVNVLATDEFTQISSEKRNGFELMKAEAVKDIKLKNTGVALIVSSSKKLLDNVAGVEDDFNLPKGVQGRRGKLINASYFWSQDLNLNNVDSYIDYAKKFGFRTFLIYYPSFVIGNDYRKLGDYDWRADTYPNGKADLEKVLQKIKQAGITPGLHVLHCHIGRESRYVRPVPDYRLNLTRTFQLSKPLNKNDTIVYVEQNPEGSMMAEKCRILKIGNELVSYRGFTTTKPYKFTGIKRAADGTIAGEAPVGAQVGILDISEFLAQSVYINQDNSLQDEIADKIANIYDAGFEFIYFDGSEGVNPPFNYTVPLAQYRVFKELNPQPLFSEGAAKAHFSWHMLSGGNAFDVFTAEEQKEAVRTHQLKEAPRMQADFTRLNFGWLSYVLPSDKTIGTQPDVLEFVTSKAAAWDSPIAMFANMSAYSKHARTTDNIEVIRRWEDVRKKNWLTAPQKKMLQNPDQEYFLITNEKNDYELLPYEQITNIADHSREVRAFIFKRGADWYVMYWHISDNKNLELPLKADNVTLYKDFKTKVAITSSSSGNIVLPANDRKYLRFKNLTKDQIIKAFQNAKILD
jgi:hypothetical protein